jgi:hypothetical protein
MVLKDIIVTYGGCKYCESASCITSYIPTTFISLPALKAGLKRNCSRCGAVLPTECIKAKVTKRS